MSQSATRTDAAVLAAIPIQRTALSAWRFSQDNLRGEARPLEIVNHLPLDQLAQELATQCKHKDRFAIQVSDLVTGKAILHLYDIKQQSSRRWVPDLSRAMGGYYLGVLYPVRWASIAVNAFAPIEAFAWSPGCDTVGAERFIEGASL